MVFGTIFKVSYRSGFNRFCYFVGSSDDCLIEEFQPDNLV